MSEMSQRPMVYSAQDLQPDTFNGRKSHFELRRVGCAHHCRVVAVLKRV